MAPRLIRPWLLVVALMVLIGASAREAFGWGRSYYPCYHASGYTYYYQTPTYYYPAPAPAVSAAAPSAGQPYVAMKPVIETPPSPAIGPAPVPQYYAPAVNGGSYGGGYGSSGNVPRSSWDFGRFPPY